MADLSRWNAHQKFAAAIRRMAHYEERVRKTRFRVDPAMKKANTTARLCLARAYFDVQDYWRQI